MKWKDFRIHRPRRSGFYYITTDVDGMIGLICLAYWDEYSFSEKEMLKKTRDQIEQGSWIRFFNMDGSERNDLIVHYYFERPSPPTGESDPL